MITQFGLYPRLFAKKRSDLEALISKYSTESLSGKPKGQVIKIYFNLLRTNADFKAEVDNLIKTQGSKLLTIQQRVMGKKLEKVKKATNGGTNVKVEDTAPMTNFLNASEATTTDLGAGSEADFIAACEYEEKQEIVSGGIKIVLAAAVIYGVWYLYKKYMK